ncbi:hypothetical protein evm_005513 [Chilo suppressalis]|nr:hypothetical protein evm_005513 [Chilo suppressalis]
MAADTGMDTCPSPEITDSRKRPLDGDSENGDVKRSHFSSVQDLVTALPLANGHGNITSHFAVEPTYHFKVLVPSMVAGAIIGKGGETIAQLQKDTGARVKMSKSHDFYPGTTERACLITGSVDGIMVVLDFIMDKIKEKPELVKPFPEGVDAKMPQDRDKQHLWCNEKKDKKKQLLSRLISGARWRNWLARSAAVVEVKQLS